MYRWWCKKSISLSGIAIYGINQDKSEICGPVDKVWLEATEILALSKIAIKSIENTIECEQS